MCSGEATSKLLMLYHHLYMFDFLKVCMRGLLIAKRCIYTDYLFKVYHIKVRRTIHLPLAMSYDLRLAMRMNTKALMK